MKALISIAAMSVAILSAGAGSAYAGVIYDNGGPDQASEAFADAGYVFTIAADEFTLTAGSNTISGVDWWGGCDGTVVSNHTTCSSTNSFTLYIYSDSSGSPGTQLDSYSVGGANQTATGKLLFGEVDEYSYSASIPNLVLTPGTQYWLGISDASNPLDIFGWETANNVSGDAYSFDGAWGGDDIELAFNLTGPTPTSAVPEPDTLALFGAGLGALFMLRRRAKTLAS